MKKHLSQDPFNHVSDQGPLVEGVQVAGKRVHGEPGPRGQGQRQLIQIVR